MTPIKVFIFEDEWMCREAIASVVSKTKEIEVVGDADNVDEGLEKALGLQPDVIIMDIRLKGKKSGIEATKEITTKLPQAKVVIFTSFPDEENLHAAVKAGAKGYLLKKEVNEPDTLIRAICTVYGGEAYITPAITAKILDVIRNYQKNGTYGLTAREKEILQLMGDGKDNRQIAQDLGIHIRTVANHVSNILFKMNAKNRTEAVVIARKEGLI